MCYGCILTPGKASWSIMWCWGCGGAHGSHGLMADQLRRLLVSTASSSQDRTLRMRMLGWDFTTPSGTRKSMYENNHMDHMDLEIKTVILKDAIVFDVLANYIFSKEWSFFKGVILKDYWWLHWSMILWDAIFFSGFKELFPQFVNQDMCMAWITWF